MNKQKYIFGIKGHLLGEVFETDDGFAFHHVGTDTTLAGFDSFDAAESAWVCFHEEYFENLPR